MPSKGDTQINNFVGGIITEASPLSFPPNASIDEINFELRRDGSRQRRLGLNYEDSHALVPTALTTDQLSQSRQRHFVWPNPSGYSDVEIGVAQIGGKLFFMNLLAASPSANLLNGGAAIDSGLTGNVIINFAIINDDLAVVSSALSTPYLLKYNGDTDVVTFGTAPLKIRDLYGVLDETTVGERPAALTPDHEYNLLNQGWDSNITSTCVPALNPIECTRNQLGVYPSNSDTWSLGKIADVASADHDKYDPLTLKKNSFDIGRAPRGHFVIDLHDRGSSRFVESGVQPSAVDRETGLVSTVASYAGRLFYSGLNSKVIGGDVFSPNMAGVVLFSQIARSDADLVKCYQENDPTSPNLSDILDTDGGVLQVAGAVNIVKLLEVKTSLFVFAENGVWEIRGDDGGFRATSFQVNKVSSIGVLSPESIVEANGVLFFWGEDAIYSLTPNQVTGESYDATNLTITTIQRGYNALPNIAKRGAKGWYDLGQNKIRWLYLSDDPDVEGDPIDIQDPVEIIITEDGTPVEGPAVNILDSSRLEDNKFIIALSSSSNNYSVVIGNVSGRTVTLVAEQILTASLGANKIKVVGLSGTTALVANQVGSSTTLTVVDITASDVASITSTTALTFASGYFFDDLEMLTSTLCVISARNGSLNRNIHAIDMSSGSPVMGATPLSIAGVSGGTGIHTDSELRRVSDTTVAFLGGNTSQTLTVNTTTVSGSTGFGVLLPGGLQGNGPYFIGHTRSTNVPVADDQFMAVLGYAGTPAWARKRAGVVTTQQTVMWEISSTETLAIFAANGTGGSTATPYKAIWSEIPDSDADGIPNMSQTLADTALFTDTTIPVSQMSGGYVVSSSSRTVFWVARQSSTILIAQVITV